MDVQLDRQVDKPRSEHGCNGPTERCERCHVEWYGDSTRRGTRADQLGVAGREANCRRNWIAASTTRCFTEFQERPSRVKLSVCLPA